MPRRLRIKNEFGKRSAGSGTIAPKNIYVISVASEGKTEEQYFDGIYDMDSSDIIKVERLEKSERYDKQSHPNHIIELLNERKEYWKEHGIEPNELWMVIDRDKQNVSKKQLNAIIEKCKEEGYNLAIYNPTFELWLLLHIANIEDYDKGILLSNSKERLKSKKRFIERELSKKLNGYSKNNLQFKRFESGINKAIKQAKDLHTDNEELIDKLGTSVCILVEKLTP